MNVRQTAQCRTIKIKKGRSKKSGLRSNKQRQQNSGDSRAAQEESV